MLITTHRTFLLLLSFFFSSVLHAKPQPMSVPLPTGIVFESNYFEDFSDRQEPVKMVYRGEGYHAFFYEQSVVFRFHNAAHSERDEIRMTFKTPNKDSLSIKGEEPLRTMSHYLLGYLSKNIHQSVHRYRRIVYENIYDQIDLHFYVNGSDIEYDFIVNPLGDPSAIHLAFSGMDRIEQKEGALIIEKNGKTLVQHAPHVYQTLEHGKHAIQAAYILSKQEKSEPGMGKRILHSAQVAFDVADYKKDVPLIIDPVLTHSSYLGGSSEDDITDIALDQDGNLYVLGVTRSVDFPVVNPVIQPHLNVLEDLFVAKFIVDKDGFTPVFSTYIGGSGLDIGAALTVDSVGNIYITGSTTSADFPLGNAVIGQIFQANKKGSKDAFVIRLNATGTQIDNATFFGGSADDSAKDLLLLSDGSLYIAGDTRSTDLVTVNSFQATLRGANDVFFAHFDGALSRLLSASYWGGGEDEFLAAIALDNANNLYLAGQTSSIDFPVFSPFQATSSGNGDAFISKISAQNSVIFSSYIGGKFKDFAADLTVNANGEAYVLGFTESPDFPVTSNVWQRQIADDTGVLDPITGTGGDPLNPIGDLFLSQFNALGSALIYSSYMGGNGFEQPGGVGIDNANRVYISGSTTSPNMFDRFLSGAGNASGNVMGAVFDLTKAGAAALEFSSIITGNHRDIARTVTVEPTGESFYIGGRTESTNLNTLNALQAAHAGSVSDAFISKFGVGIDLDAFVGFQQGTIIPIGKGLPVTMVHSVINNGPDTATNIRVEITVPSTVQFEQLRVIQGTTDCGANTPDQNFKIFCTITELLKADSARIDVIITPKNVEELSFSIEVQADQADTNPDNNAHTFKTIVANFPGEGNTGIPNALEKPGTGGGFWLVLLLVMWKVCRCLNRPNRINGYRLERR